MLRNINIATKKRYVLAGELIIEQGALGSNAYVIESGRVEVFMKNALGEEVTVAELGPGSLIGELAAVGDGQRDVGCRALEAASLIPISALDFSRAGKKPGGGKRKVNEKTSLLKKILSWLVR